MTHRELQIEHRPSWRGSLLALALALAALHPGAAAADDIVMSDHSLEDLLNIEVTSVSRKAERLVETSSAVHVITREDIRRSGLNTVPELLRLVPGLEVQRTTSNVWAIGSRGFSSRFANDLLVLIDGRSVYTPLFGGVYWDVQDIMLEDVDRIEVIRGPGATVWGTNAVNGVINVITRSADQTQGSFVSVAAGNEDRVITSFRHGGRLSPDVTFRAFGKYANRDPFEARGGATAPDEWRAGRLGFRTDWQASDRDTVSFSGESYRGDSGERVRLDDALNLALGLGSVDFPDINPRLKGGDVRFQWQRQLAEDSSFELAAYYDRHDRVVDDSFSNRQATYDLMFQHRLPFGSGHDVTWGMRYRLNRNRFESSPNARLRPETGRGTIYSAFAQDEIALVPDRLRFTLGSKFEWNDSTGWEVQPTARALWTPTEHQQVWASVARAVRLPSRADTELAEFTVAVIPAGIAGCPGITGVDPACHPGFTGNPDADSEKLVALEMGYRIQQGGRLSLDLAAFSNDYENQLGSVIGLAADPFVATSVNRSETRTYGAEAYAQWVVNDWWRLALAYSRLHISTGESSPTQQAQGHSYMTLPGGLELDTHLYYVARVETSDTGSYWRLDARLGWRPRPGLELALVGQNLTQERHDEDVDTVFPIPVTNVERSFYAKAIWRF